MEYRDEPHYLRVTGSRTPPLNSIPLVDQVGKHEAEAGRSSLPEGYPQSARSSLAVSVYRYCDRVWKLRERNGAGTNSVWQLKGRTRSNLGRQVRVEVGYQARIATEVPKTPH